MFYPGIRMLSFLVFGLEIRYMAVLISHINTNKSMASSTETDSGSGPYFRLPDLPVRLSSFMPAKRISGVGDDATYQPRLTATGQGICVPIRALRFLSTGLGDTRLRELYSRVSLRRYATKRLSA